MSEPREPSKAETFVDSMLASPHMDFYSADGRVRVHAHVGVAAQDGVTPSLILRETHKDSLDVRTVALRNDNALALAAFILDTFKLRGDDLSLAS